MAQKTKTSTKVGMETKDEHELLEQDNFGWLADMRNVLSPYWSSRVEYHADKNGSVLVLEDTRSPNR